MTTASGTFTTNSSVITNAEGAGKGAFPYVTMAAKGTWGGASVHLEGSFHGHRGEWFPITDSELSEDGCISLAVSADNIRIVCTGGTAHSIKWAVK